MFKSYLLATTIIAGTASVATAQAFNGEIGGHVGKGATYEVTLDVGVEAAITESATVFGNVEVLGFGDTNDTDAVIETWNLGVRTGNLELSFGEQDDLFDLGDGLNEVGGNVLVDPSADVHNIQASFKSYDFMIGLTDVTDSSVEVTNVQMAATHSFANGVGVTGVVDYNRTSEDLALGVAVDYTLKNEVALAGAFTYKDKFAYQTGASYKNVTGYVAGDELDVLAEAGLGYEWKVGKVDAFAEVAYDFRTDEAEPAVGVSFKF